MSCPDCFKGHVHSGDSRGTLQDHHGYKTYVSLPPSTDTTSPPKSTIIFFPDAFGLNLVNNKILADYYAQATGCRVLLPDIFPNGAASLASMHAMNNVVKPIESWYEYLNPFMYLGKGISLVTCLSSMVPFMIYNAPQNVFPECLRYTREVRAGLPSDGKLGVAGFCWGGYPCTKLCCEPLSEGSGRPLIDACFVAHPSALKAPDDVVQAIGKFKVPYSCAVAEFDFLFDKGVAENTEVAVREKVAEGEGIYEFKLWKGCHHGFSVRASNDDGSIGKEGYEGAAKQAVDWFNKYLK